MGSGGSGEEGKLGPVGRKQRGLGALRRCGTSQNLLLVNMKNAGKKGEDTLERGEDGAQMGGGCDGTGKR